MTQKPSIIRFVFLRTAVSLGIALAIVLGTPIAIVLVYLGLQYDFPEQRWASLYYSANNNLCIQPEAIFLWNLFGSYLHF